MVSGLGQLEGLLTVLMVEAGLSAETPARDHPTQPGLPLSLAGRFRGQFPQEGQSCYHL